jgi:hypothetical protein
LADDRRQAWLAACTEASSDSALHSIVLVTLSEVRRRQTIERKARFIGQIMTAPDQLARQVVDEDVVADEYATLKAIAAGDPRLIRQAQLESRLTTRERARAVHQRTMGRFRDHLATAIATTARLAAAIREVDTLLVAHRPDDSSPPSADSTGR